MTKFKLTILICFILGLALSTERLMAQEGLWALEAQEAISEPLWRVSGFLPPKEEGENLRTLNWPEKKLVLEMLFAEALSPWPSRLRISKTDEQGLFTIVDARPFGGPNLAKFNENDQKVPLTLTEYNFFLKALAEDLSSNFPRLSEAPKWLEKAPGLWAAKVGPLYGVRLGSPHIFLFKIDPEKFEIAPFHESEFSSPELEEKVDMEGWLSFLPEATIIINGGQYYPDRSYMGLLKRGELVFSEKEHHSWQGFFLSSPKKEMKDWPKATILDRETEGRGLEISGYENVVQSFMLLDELRRIRVKESQNLSSRTAIAEDEEGHIVVLMAQGAISLYDLAMILQSPNFKIKKALALDGGFEAQMALRLSDKKETKITGVYSISPKRALFVPGYTHTLPSVLAIKGKKNE